MTAGPLRRSNYRAFLFFGFSQPKRSRSALPVGEGIDSTAVRSDAWHHLSDAITSALGFVGISIALWTRNPAADDWAAL